jgi:hypothetical protein
METISQHDREILRGLAAHTAVACGQPLEIIRKGTHTLESQPWQIKRWVAIAREEAAKTK